MERIYSELKITRNECSYCVLGGKVTIGRVRSQQHSWGKFKATGLEVSLDF